VHLNTCGPRGKAYFIDSLSLFLRRRLGVQASQGPGRPGRLANPRLIRFSLYLSHFLSFFTDMASPCLALYSPRRRLGISKGADRLTSPCRLKNIVPYLLISFSACRRLVLSKFHSESAENMDIKSQL
jgi:hypothetical protein